MNDEIKYWLEGLDNLSFNKVLNYITNLQQENERLKVDEHFFTECGFTNIVQLALCYVDYKSRCEKAIEYINNYPVNACHYLLNILQNGGDKDE